MADGKASELLPMPEALGSGTHWPVIKEVLDGLHTGDEALKAVTFLSCLTSGLRDKLHVIVVGKSQHGKSHMESAMAELFPHGTFEVLNSSSAKAFYYKAGKEGPNYFKNKIILLDEFRDNSDTWAVAKALTTQGSKNVKHWTVKDGEHLELNIEEPPVVLTNTVEAPEDEQLDNRFFIGNVDESPSQGVRIREFQNREAMYGKYAQNEAPRLEDARAIVRKILEERDVDILIPHARLLEAPQRSPSVNFPKFLTLLKAITYMNRFQRRRLGEKGPYVATETDADQAHALWKTFEPHQNAQVDSTAIMVLEKVPHGDWTATPDLILECKALGLEGHTVRRKLEKLYGAGLVDRQKGERYNEWEYRKESEALHQFSSGCARGPVELRDPDLRRETYVEWFSEAVLRVSHDGGLVEEEAGGWAEYIMGTSHSVKLVKAVKLE